MDISENVFETSVSFQPLNVLFYLKLNFLLFFSFPSKYIFVIKSAITASVANFACLNLSSNILPEYLLRLLVVTY